MHPTSHCFKDNAHKALQDPVLRQALGNIRTGFQDRRAQTIAKLPEWERLRDAGKALKDHILQHLDHYLEQFEAKVTEAGGQVHWARTAEEARQQILAICQAAGARTVTKGKSMIAEEIALNAYLEANQIRPIETDLGEYIIQLRNEPPSHIIAPAMHLVKEQVAEAFRAAHTHLDPARPLDEPRDLLDEARAELRAKFLAADVGITGANFFVAETGSTLIVTNEGNGDLTQLLPRVHIVITSIEKVVPTFEDAQLLLRLLARSATGQEYSSYTTFSTGPRRAEDLDGPEEFHVVLLDNGRSSMLGTSFQDMLRCIRCSACLNHCPVYEAVGGHAYGWVYPGPMGAVLTPQLLGLDQAGPLPNASTLCGRCAQVCPMQIPLPDMMRHWREEQVERKLVAPLARWALKAWGMLATRPALYRLTARISARLLARRSGRHRSLPLAGAWTSVRDMPASQGKSFQELWREQRR